MTKDSRLKEEGGKIGGEGKGKGGEGIDDWK